MLEVTIKERNLFDESSGEFIHIEGAKLQLEHSLVSVQKWEAIHHKPFLETDNKTLTEIKDYIRCMTLNPENVIDRKIYDYIPGDVVSQIVSYIKNPMTATWFNNKLQGAQKWKNEVVTAEIIYYWMIIFNIPEEYRKWHLNQLLTLIKVVSIKQQPPKKVDKKQAALERDRINDERRRKYNTKG